MINQIINGDVNEFITQIADNKVDLILTDPPYEVDYNAKSKHLSKLGKPRDKQIQRDKHFVDKIINYDFLAEQFHRVLKDNKHAYVFCGDRQIPVWFQSMTKAGFKPPQILVWRKNKVTFDMTMGHKFPENKEFILFFHKGWGKLNGYKVERNKFRSCLDFKSDGKTELHSCAKPEKLIEYLIKLSSEKNDIIFDPFMGSGTTGVCAKRNNRKFIGFELSKEYCEKANLRIQKTTSIKDWF